MSVSTFPYHQHTSDGQIVSANVSGLEAVLREIEASIAANANQL
jgi:hypothetical protein